MEKVPGVALAERWESMSTLDRYEVIDQVVQMEKELESLVFPAYGSIFLRDRSPDGFRSCPLPSDLDPAGLFCVGPACHRSAGILDPSKLRVDDKPCQFSSSINNSLYFLRISLFSGCWLTLLQGCLWVTLRS
jgi:hypothetical protein